jgi:hypothetical protein
MVDGNRERELRWYYCAYHPRKMGLRRFGRVILGRHVPVDHICPFDSLSPQIRHPLRSSFSQRRHSVGGRRAAALFPFQRASPAGAVLFGLRDVVAGRSWCHRVVLHLENGASLVVVLLTHVNALSLSPVLEFVGCRLPDPTRETVVPSVGGWMSSHSPPPPSSAVSIAC